jgi:hypothetical protein
MLYQGYGIAMRVSKMRGVNSAHNNIININDNQTQIGHRVKNTKRSMHFLNPATVPPHSETF